MLDPARERAHLDQANADIAAGEVRVAAQLRLIQRLHADHHDTADAMRLLEELQAALYAWRVHRQRIIEQLQRS